MNQPKRQSAVRTGPNLQEYVRARSLADTAWIDHKQLRAPSRGRDHALSQTQKIAIGVGAPEHNAAAMREIRQGQAAGAKRVGGGRCVAGPLTEMGGADE